MNLSCISPLGQNIAHNICKLAQWGLMPHTLLPKVLKVSNAQLANP